jgi:hypothetical protein
VRVTVNIDAGPDRQSVEFLSESGCRFHRPLGNLARFQPLAQLFGELGV